jgi:hypothetical protein
MGESNYWLRLIKAIITLKATDKELDFLTDESNQLKKILGAIVTKTNKL